MALWQDEGVQRRFFVAQMQLPRDSRYPHGASPGACGIARGFPSSIATNTWLLREDVPGTRLLTPIRPAATVPRMTWLRDSRLGRRIRRPILTKDRTVAVRPSH